MERYAEKLRSIILLQFELLNVGFVYRRTLDPLMFMSSVGRVVGPQNQYHFSIGDLRTLCLGVSKDRIILVLWLRKKFTNLEIIHMRVWGSPIRKSKSYKTKMEHNNSLEL